MKKTHIISFAFAALMSVAALSGCSKNGSDIPLEFDFSIGIEGDYSALEISDQKYRLVVYDNGVDTQRREYTYKSSNEAYASVVPTTGFITTHAPGRVRFTVTETRSGIEEYKVINVIEASDKATGGYNYSAAATEEQIDERTEILGKLEKYAMDTHLTGISLFENGGYVCYSDRSHDLLGDRRYVTGFGYGLLSDSDPFTEPLSGSAVDKEFPLYYHTASSSDPLTINALDASGSQVSDLSGYITSSYFSTKLNNEGTNAIWYPLLADRNAHVNDPETDNPMMFHLGPKNGSGMYTGWRIYVRTDLAYKYNGTLANPDPAYQSFNNYPVKLADYEFALRFLLTGSHNLKRGNEMAADTSYGIKGANSYNALTKSSTSDAFNETTWENMKKSHKLGIRTGEVTADKPEVYEGEGRNYPVGKYIEFELINPIDSFTAMYTLSSSLYSPLPKEFIQKIGARADGEIDDESIKRASKRYGTFNNNDTVPAQMKNNIVESTICLGAYYLNKWDKETRIVFTHNTDWFEYKEGRYQIEGVRMRINTSINENPDAYYNDFINGNLDSCSLPQKHLKEKSNVELHCRKVPGDSVFKLNVNSCTREQWDERFGPSGKISAGHSWDVKPWMSNDAFLNGLFWSIDRKSFAEKRGVEPSINYFSDSYMSYPQKNISYNSTQAHKDAVKSYHNVINKGGEQIDDYGYNKDKAVTYFKTAVSQLVKQGKLNYGTSENPTVIKIEIWWMYQSDITDYGTDIKGYFETAFNDPSVSHGRIKLNVVNNAVTVWEYVYDQHLQVGEFDLGFGAISGNTYNPLNFLEVLKSDNSSTFTLNWGADTSKIDDRYPLVYKDNKYSFDALWEVADHGGVVKDGVNVKPVEECYLSTFSTLSSGSAKTDTSVELEYKFVEDVGESVKFAMESVSLYVIGGQIFGEDDGVSYDKDTHMITLTYDAQKAIEESIQKANKWDAATYTGDEKYKDHLTRECYKKYWLFDVTYSIKIGEGQETLNSVTAGRTSSDDPYGY